jgi:hypothetical protein
MLEVLCSVKIIAESEDKLVIMKIIGFWNLRSCGMIEAHQRYRRSCSLCQLVMEAVG